MNLRALRWSRRSTIVAAIVAATVVGGGVAYAATAQPAIKTFTPRVADQVTNVDVLRQQIRNYYGDPLGTGTYLSRGVGTHRSFYPRCGSCGWKRRTMRVWRFMRTCENTSMALKSTISRGKLPGSR